MEGGLGFDAAFECMFAFSFLAEIHARHDQHGRDYFLLALIMVFCFAVALAATIPDSDEVAENVSDHEFLFGMVWRTVVAAVPIMLLVNWGTAIRIPLVKCVCWWSGPRVLAWHRWCI